MFRKIALTALAAVLVAASITVVPANAATKISNGVACSKSGAKAKSDGTNYRCAKNPMVKNSKLTWLSTDCISQANAYLKSQANLPKIKSSTDATLAMLDAEIAAQKVESDKAAVLIADYQAKIAKIQVSLAALKADTANLVKNKKPIADYEGAIKSYEAAIKAFSTVGRSLNRSQAAKDQAAQTYKNAQSELGSARQMANLICTKGF
jgi:exonuclease VII small subunit